MFNITVSTFSFKRMFNSKGTVAKCFVSIENEYEWKENVGDNEVYLISWWCYTLASYLLVAPNYVKVTITPPTLKLNGHIETRNY